MSEQRVGTELGWIKSGIIESLKLEKTYKIKSNHERKVL